LSDILDPSKGAEEAMKEMGTSAEELRQALGEEGLLPVLLFFKQQLESNNAAISDIFPNVKALTGVLQLVGKNADEVRKVFADLQDNTGDLDYAFGVASRSAAFKF